MCQYTNKGLITGKYCTVWVWVGEIERNRWHIL